MSAQLRPLALNEKRCTHRKLIKRKETRKDIAWCGTWFDCPCGGYTELIPSKELRTKYSMKTPTEFEKFKEAVKVIVNAPKEKKRKPKKQPKEKPKKKGGK